MSSARVHPTAIVEDGVQVGDGSVLWDGVHVRRGAQIGRGCIVGEKAYIAYGVRIGDLVKINAHAYLCAGVEIGDGCLVAAHVVFTNDRAPRATDPDLRGLLPSEPGPDLPRCQVGRGASIGANATIGPGVTLGAFSMVGMGSVVTRDVPAHGLVVGNPARLVGLVARDGARVLSVTQGSLPDHAEVVCPGDGRLVVESGVVRHVP